MTQRRRTVAEVLAIVVLVLFGSVWSTTATAAADPSGAGADSAPAGSNDWACRPSPQHPRPVILVHGTGMSMQQSWSTLSPVLRGEGYCVFALNYGAAAKSWGSGDIRNSARELAAFVDTVRARTGAAQVDIVGHSQGGTTARQYLRFEGGTDPVTPARNKVRSLVMLAPTTHGTTFNGMQDLFNAFTSLRLTDEATNQAIVEFTFGLASYQQLIGSRFLEQLNSGRETMPGVDYTVIASQTDEIVTPPIGSFLLPDPGSSVRNMWVQDVCPGARLSHADLLYDPRPVFLVQAALDPARGQRSAPC
ncbi:alpha/beta fold hydrolase [Rhodococcus sp. ABRD24]|uniref:esterase/lipase family protein n=1 Tax=Rhodococcus sp. ABRD24 TaxID=2507582 RepID=UPI001038C501|nr:alpha/beta fold hydrolase [Rhodococcus sp. ABRD24]QBJ95557.1 alpha/beta fold hydrolase [Rhodococcus sp. ABRD24]